MAPPDVDLLLSFPPGFGIGPELGVWPLDPNPSTLNRMPHPPRRMGTPPPVAARVSSLRFGGVGVRGWGLGDGVWGLGFGVWG